MPESCVKVVQDMYGRRVTSVRSSVGITGCLRVEVGLHQGAASSRLLFAMLMDRLTEEVGRESPWTMMFADDLVICERSRE